MRVVPFFNAPLDSSRIIQCIVKVMRFRLSRIPLLVTSFAVLVALAMGSSLTLATQSQAVVGGRGASQPRSWAVQVVGKGWLCSGSLIGDSWVLTAAHCAKGVQASDITIRVGGVHKGEGASHSIDHTYVHPGFESLGGEGSSAHDLALLHLRTATKKVPITLGGDVSVGDYVTAYGYGEQTNNRLSNILKSATDEVVNIGPGVFNSIRTYPSPGKVYHGDSGGPWLNSIGEQIGVVSRSLGCTVPKPKDPNQQPEPCGITEPQQATRIAPNRAWISSISGI